MTRRAEDAERLEDQQEQQFAYDSMSTIFEVESEDSNSSAEDRQRESGELIGIEKRWRIGELESEKLVSQQESSKDEAIQRVSPVNRDRFSGTLNALSEQVERLRRRSAELAIQTHTPIAQIATTSSSPQAAPTRETEIKSSSKQQEEQEEIDKQQQNDDELLIIDDHHRERQLGSAESLMMISLSPSSSPKAARVPVLRSKPRKQDELKEVEVSNKSTITAIDLELMDQLVSRFFVDTRDQGTQSIEFDCPTTTTNKLNKRSVAVGTEKFSRERFSPLPPTQTRGTQTKSSSDSIDLGASETRRFKLSHLHFQPVRRLQNQQQQQQHSNVQQNNDHLQSVGLENIATPDDDESQVVDPSSLTQRQVPAIVSKLQPQASTVDKSAELTLSQQINSSARSSSLELGSSEKDSLNLSNRTAMVSKVSDDENNTRESGEKGEDSLASSPQPEKMLEYNRKEDGNNKNKVWSTSLPSPSSLSEASDSLIAQAARNSSSKDVENEEQTKKKSKQVAVERKASELVNGKTKVKENLAQTERNYKEQQTIPRVKTEVRVVIEIKDSKGRQISELRSDSELAPNRVRRLSELTTSRQVTVSPSQVLEKLRNAGREHSLVYGSLAGERAGGFAATRFDYPTATQLFASSSSPNLLSSAGQARKSAVAGRANDGGREREGEEKWQQVSHSSIKNEIETEIRDVNRGLESAGRQSNRNLEVNSRSDGKSARAKTESNNSTLLLLSTQANVRNPADVDSGERCELELSQHATRYSQSGSRTTERRLVEGGASFNEGMTVPQSPATPTTPTISKDELRVQAPSGSWSLPVERQSQKSTTSPRYEKKLSETQPVKSSVDKAGTPVGKANRVESIRHKENIGQKEPVRSTRFELEEERDERKQVSENGRLIYDDRLRERRFERSTNVRPKSASPALSRTRGEQQLRATETRSPVSNLHRDGGQNSRLSSSSPETMDSGFAQTEQGLASSGSALNLIRPPVTTLKPRPLSVGPVVSSSSSAAAAAAAAAAATTVSQHPSQLRSSQLIANGHNNIKLNNLDDSTESLNFVDDDADELIEQLGGERQVSYRTPAHFSTRRSLTTPLPLPPPAFRSPSARHEVVTPATPTSPSRLAADTTPGTIVRRRSASKSSALVGSSLSEPAEATGGTSTELCTRLTRRKRTNHLRKDRDEEQPAAQTRLEQSVFVPVGARQGESQASVTGKRVQQSGIQAQVAFESDTDSMAERGNSANSGQSVRSGQLLASSSNFRQRAQRANVKNEKLKKELLSETRFSRASHAPLISSSSTGAVPGAEERARTRSDQGDWDYSLRVNRIRGDRVDSRVSTHVKHSRRALINSEAS